MLRYVRSFSITLPRMAHREIFVMQEVNPLSEVAGDAFGVVKALTKMPVFASEAVSSEKSSGRLLIGNSP